MSNAPRLDGEREQRTSPRRSLPDGSLRDPFGSLPCTSARCAIRAWVKVQTSARDAIRAACCLYASKDEIAIEVVIGTIGVEAVDELRPVGYVTDERVDLGVGEAVTVAPGFELVLPIE